MHQRWRLAGLLLVGCADSTTAESPPPAFLKSVVSVANGTARSVDVTLTPVADEPILFERVLAGTTTPSRELELALLEGIAVDCGGACGEGTVDLDLEAAHTLLVLPDAAPILDPVSLTAPLVTQTSPADGRTDVARNTSLRVTFDQTMDPETLSAGCSGTIQLTDATETCVDLGELASDDGHSFAAAPLEPLLPEATYTLRVDGYVRNLDGRPLEAPFSATFTTGLSVDDTPPAPVAEATAEADRYDTVTLEWEASGDDGTEGIASSYDVRFVQGICPFTFDEGIAATGEPEPSEPGRLERVTITGLAGGTPHCFGIAVTDEVPNRSEVAFVDFVTPVNDDVTPPAVATLTLDSVFASSVRVNWTAVGDDGTEGRADFYELRYASGRCPEHDGAVFTSGTRAEDLPPPLAAGTGQSKTVDQLEQAAPYCFVLRVVDDGDNASFSDPAQTRTLEEYW